MKWLTTTGGPFILSGKEAAAHWCGINNSPYADAPSDYDRACSVRDYLGVISKSDKVFLVLADEPFPTAVTSDRNGHVLLVRWVYAENESSIVDALEEICPDDNGWNFELTLDWQERELVLFDSSAIFADDLEHAVMRISPGPKRLQSTEFHKPGLIHLILHRIV